MRGKILVMGMVLAAGMVQAKTCTWTGGDGDWFDAAGWEGGAVPEEGDDVVLAGTKGATLDLQGRETVPLASLAFGDGAGGDWVLMNGTLRLADDGTIWVCGSFHNIFSVAAVLSELDFRILNAVTWRP